MSRNLVAGFIFRESPNESGAAEYLALHRSLERGNYWQSVTGGIEVTDSAPADAIYREVGEELGLVPLEVIDTGYSFLYHNKYGVPGTEYVFGVRVDTQAQPTLLDEHDARLWVPYPGMQKLIRGTWAENTTGLGRVHDWVREALPYTPERTFDERNYSVVVVTPTAFDHGAEEEIVEGFRSRGLTTVASIGALQLDTAKINSVWQEVLTKPQHYQGAINLITRRPVDVHLVEGARASEHVQAVKCALQAKYGIKSSSNPKTIGTERAHGEPLIYATRSMEGLASRAIALFGATALNEAVEQRLYATV